MSVLLLNGLLLLLSVLLLAGLLLLLLNVLRIMYGETQVQCTLTCQRAVDAFSAEPDSSLDHHTT